MPRLSGSEAFRAREGMVVFTEDELEACLDPLGGGGVIIGDLRRNNRRLNTPPSVCGLGESPFLGGDASPRGVGQSPFAGPCNLMGMVGTFLGPWGVPATLCGGALLGTTWVLASGRGRVVPDAKLPFGTFLALAAAPLLLWGEGLAAWYLGRF